MGALLLAIVSWIYAHRDFSWALWSGDANQYAEMGRRLAQGEGFTTGVIFPAELAFGADADHPALVRPPAWPLALAVFFAAAGPSDGIAHAAVALFYLATVIAATLLTVRLADHRSGALAGIAVATAPYVLLMTMDGVSEISFSFWITLTFLLCASMANAFWVGFACGLAYLTRYNGILLLPIVLLLVARRGETGRPILLCLMGFGLVALPWWIRNLIVTGNPFYSLLNLNFYFSPSVSETRSNLLFMLEPDLSAAIAMDPLDKAKLQLLPLLRSWPLASANLVGCMGVALGCVKGDRLSLGFGALALATTLAIAFLLPNGRYLIPLVPPMLALGVVAWVRHGGRLRAPALLLILVAPLLPAIPSESVDLHLFRDFFAQRRELVREGRFENAATRFGSEALRRCLAARPLVLAQDAPALTWRTGAISIYAPADPHEFWRIVEAYPVQFVQIRRWKEIERWKLAARFEPRPECAPDLFERRPTPTS
jgi:4-amino-4-deoxy-L-arabinose transferase-like glycosyltransferase